MLTNGLLLAKRLEAAVWLSHKAYVNAHQQRFPEANASFLDLSSGGGALISADDPMSQAIGLGLNGEMSTEELTGLVDFYHQQHMACNIELCPLTHLSVLDFVNQEAFSAVEFSTILYRELADVLSPKHPKDIEIIKTDDSATWAEVCVRGFANGELIDSWYESFYTFSKVSEVTCYLGIMNDKPVAGGALGIYDDVCDLGFTSTLPDYRGLGLQKALIYQRLANAKARGVELALSTTEPGSLSQQNLQKHGFNVAYTRTKFEKEYKG